MSDATLTTDAPVTLAGEAQTATPMVEAAAARGPATPTHRHWIVVPCYNERKWIEQTVDAIAAQTDTEFVLLIVNNASTDETRAIAERRIASHSQLTGMVLDEPDKGTGCAADTGFRFAIDNGAEIVFRTDADCVPTPTWFAELKRTMIEKKLDAAGGRVRIRTDDVELTRTTIMMSRIGSLLVPRIGPLLRSNRGEGYLSPYVLMPGPNVAIRATTYTASGGYPRRSFDTNYLDKDIANAVRRTTPNISHARTAVVHASERRTAGYGVRGTIAWMLRREAPVAATDLR